MDDPALYLSSYILKHKKEYYTNLKNVTEKEDWETWIMYVLDMIEMTALKGKMRIEKIQEAINSMGKEIQRKLPKIYSKDLLETLFHLPYSKRSSFAQAGLGNLKTSGNYLINLEEKGFLKSILVGKEKLYLNYRLMEILKIE
jgi:Fic family protein